MTSHTEMHRRTHWEKVAEENAVRVEKAERMLAAYKKASQRRSDEAERVLKVVEDCATADCDACLELLVIALEAVAQGGEAMSEIYSASKYEVEDDVRRATSWQELEARVKKAERELESLLSFSEGREHKCDDACSWAHSEYVKFIFKEARGEVRYRDVLLVRWCHSEGGADGERLYEDTMKVLDPEDKGHGLHDPCLCPNLGGMHKVDCGCPCPRCDLRDDDWRHHDS